MAGGGTLDGGPASVYFSLMQPVSRPHRDGGGPHSLYANAAPFYALWADAPFAVRNLVPTRASGARPKRARSISD